MNNLINAFMEFKINYFLNCTKLLYNNNHKFIIKCMKGYFRTYIDNYYYYTYNTIDSNSEYSEENLQKEMKGIMEEMLDDYSDFELIDSNEIYSSNKNSIVELKDICFEIVKLDKLEYDNLEDLKNKITEFFTKNPILSDYLNDNIDTLIKYTKDYKSTIKKILKYKDNYFKLKRTPYEDKENKYYVTLDYDADNNKITEKYRRGLIDSIFKKDDRLEHRKMICLLNKILYQLLQDTINNEKNYYFISIDDNVFYKDRIINAIYNLMDNPLFRKYVVLCCDFHTYLSHKNVFEEDFVFACKQKFRRVSDIYKKVNAIYTEGVFNYLVVMDCKENDRNFFKEYKADGMEVLLIKED